MDRLISRTQRVCLATALFILLATLPGSAHARSSGGAGAIAVEPGGIAFPDKVLGVSGERSWPKRLKISVSEQSGQPAMIQSISIGGANAADFAVHQPENCVGATLTTGCAVTVTFTPTGLGPRTATLTVTDDSGAGARKVALSGRGIKGSIKWEPREVSFGKVRPGATSVAEPISITNPNAAPLSITAISLKSPDFTAFQTQSCVGKLAPHASCRFYVGANPTSSMAKSQKNSIKAKLQIKDNAAGSPHGVALSAVLSGTPLLPPPPPGPANLTHNILVTNTPCNNVTSYLIGAGGNVAPSFAQPLLCNPTGIAVDTTHSKIYVTNLGVDGNPSYSIAVYPTGSDGQTAPSAVIAGSATLLDFPTGVALDSSGNIYVSNDGKNNGDPDSVTVYPAGSNGNVAPSARIIGTSTGLSDPAGIAVDNTGKIYVTNNNNSVTVYPAGSNGNVAPSATIRGLSAGLVNPADIAVDSVLKIYVINDGNRTLTVYPAGSNGNIAPSATISNGLTSPAGVALDSANNIYVTNSNNNVQVYPAGSSTGAIPSATISGSGTALDNPGAIAIDGAGKIYVANDGSSHGNSDTVTVYPAGSNNNAAPSAIIDREFAAVNLTGLVTPQGIAVDSAGKIYVLNGNFLGSESVTVYPAGSNGNAAPIATISGSNTGLNLSAGIALDSSGKIYVVNNGSSTVTVYPAGSNGNVAPSATITGGPNPNTIAVDTGGNIYVASEGTDTVTVYPPGSNGAAVPSATITGVNTGLNFPAGIAVDSAGKIYVVNSANGGTESVTVYPAGSNGDAIPSATISGVNTGLNGASGIALDSGGSIYVANDFSSFGGTGAVTVYAAGSNGNAAPSMIIAGASTALGASSGIAVDSVGKIYVANQFSQKGSGSVTVYPAASNGNVAPVAVIEFITNNGMVQPVGIALDSAANIYVSNEIQVFGSSEDAVAVYSAGSGAVGGAASNIDRITLPQAATGGIALDSSQNVYAVTSGGSEVDIVSSLGSNFFPLGILHGDLTLLNNAAAIAVDASGNMYVTNDASDALGDRVTIYPAGSTGNSAPSAVIVGSNTGLAFPAGIAVDSTNIYVANKATDSVTVYPLATNGNVAPSATISGSNTGLNTPSGIALDINGLIYVTNEGGFEGINTSVTVYAAGANGNATPATTITGSSTQLARPRGIAVVP